MQKTGRQIISSLLIALMSFGIVLGGLSLSMAESRSNSPATELPLATTMDPYTSQSDHSPTSEPMIITPTHTAALVSSPTSGTSTLTPTFTPTERFVFPARTKTPFPCATPPSNWVPHIVQPKETLTSLYRIYGVSVADLQKYNCLPDPDVLQQGQVIFIPGYVTVYPTDTLVYPEPTETETPIPTEMATEGTLGTETPIPTEMATEDPPGTETPTP